MDANPRPAVAATAHPLEAEAFARAATAAYRERVEPFCTPEEVAAFKADASRVMSCLRACAGLADPERDVAELVAFVSQVRDEIGKANETDCTLTISAVADRLRIRARKLLARHAPWQEAKA